MTSDKAGIRKIRIFIHQNERNSKIDAKVYKDKNQVAVMMSKENKYAI